MVKPLEFLLKTIATGFGCGYAPIAPGTFGTALGFLIFWLFPYPLSWTFIVGTITIFFVGVWASQIAEKFYGHDASYIVIDEVAGYLISVAYLPISPGRNWWIWTIAAFILFRLFDITKPGPAYKAQALPGGWGVMVDDLIAGLYTNIVLQIVIRWISLYNS